MPVLLAPAVVPNESRRNTVKPTRGALEPGGAGWLLAGLLTVSAAGPLLAFALSNPGRRMLGEIGIRVE